MKLGEFASRVAEYAKNHPSDMEVMICDDGMVPRYFNVDSVIGSRFSREVLEPDSEDGVLRNPPKYETQDILMVVTNLMKEER